jgi:hypothetical protein
MKQSIQVSVRIRPAINDDHNCLTLQNGKLVVLDDGGTPTSFHFPSRVVTGSDQVEAFEALASDLLEKLVEGYSCTLLAYGQTGSGMFVFHLCIIYYCARLLIPREHMDLLPQILIIHTVSETINVTLNC